MFLLSGLTSCKDYLDKEPESIISADDAFKNFKNFQGFVDFKTRLIGPIWVPSDISTPGIILAPEAAPVHLLNLTGAFIIWRYFSGKIGPNKFAPV